MSRLPPTLGVLLVFASGCELVASFDRSKIEPPKATTQPPMIGDGDGDMSPPPANMDASAGDGGAGEGGTGEGGTSDGGRDASSPDAASDGGADAAPLDGGPTDAGADAEVDAGDAGPSDAGSDASSDAAAPDSGP